MSRRALRWMMLQGFAALGFAAVLSAAMVFAFPRAVVEIALARTIGRAVSIGELEIAWGATIVLRVRALTIAGDADASLEALLTVAAIDARIDGVQLLQGTLAFRSVAIDKAALVLARDGQGRGNWRFSQRQDGHDGKGRTHTPDLGDFSLTNGTVRLRTSGGHRLVIALDDLRVRGEGSSGSVAIELAGSYQGHAASLTAASGSFEALRDATRPYPVSLQLAAPQLRLVFDGTFADPLDLDGAVGSLDFSADHLGALQAFFDADATLAAALQVAGQARRNGDVWSLEAAQGHLADGRVRAKYITLLEGPRGSSDTVTADAAFDELDLSALFAERKRDGGGLRPDSAPDALRADLRIAVASLRYDKVEILREMRLKVLGGPGTYSLRDAHAHLGGGDLTFNARLQAAGARDSDLRMQARLKGAQAELLAALVDGDGHGPTPVRGRLDVLLDLRAPGTGRATMLQRGQIALAVALQNGTIERNLVEAASTDLRALFRRPGSAMALECVFGVATLKDGIGAVGPVRLRAEDGRFAASGSVDPMLGSIDILVVSDSTASGTLALDIPLRLRGVFGQMTVVPVPGARIEAISAPQIASDFAIGNPCR